MIFLIFLSLSIYHYHLGEYQIIYLNWVITVYIYKNKGENKMNKKCKNDQ
jgi:hypothetical protein